MGLYSGEPVLGFVTKD